MKTETIFKAIEIAVTVGELILDHSGNRSNRGNKSFGDSNSRLWKKGK